MIITNLQTHLLNHLTTHEVKKEQVEKFPCKQCARKFPTKAGLDSHKLDHLKLKTLLKKKQKKKKRNDKKSFRNVCQFCSKSFKKPSQCLRHERIHTGEKPFKVSKLKNIQIEQYFKLIHSADSIRLSVRPSCPPRFSKSYKTKQF